MSFLRDIVQELNEAARYCRTNPEEAKRLIDRAVTIALEHRMGWDRKWELVHNLRIATEFMRCEPDVAKGYILGASFEFWKEGAK